MRKTEDHNYFFRSTQKELAVAFFREDGKPFHHAMIGVTHPFAEYSITRKQGHRTTVFEYVVSGEGEVLIDGVWHRVTAGDTYVLRSGEPHHYRACPQKPWEKLWINYVADYAPAFLDAYGIKSGIYRCGASEPLFKRLLEYTKESTGRTAPHLEIADCVHELVRAISAEQKSGVSDALAIKEALHARLYEKLSLDALACELHISKSNLIRIFKKEFRVTPYEYLTNLKISTAKLLLRDTNMTVKEIAARLQITDEHYFSTVFLARVGERPRAYRNRKRQ